MELGFRLPGIVIAAGNVRQISIANRSLLIPSNHRVNSLAKLYQVGIINAACVTPEELSGAICPPYFPFKRTVVCETDVKGRKVAFAAVELRPGIGLPYPSHAASYANTPDFGTFVNGLMASRHGERKR